jgi:hypothetical protein
MVKLAKAEMYLIKTGGRNKACSKVKIIPSGVDITKLFYHAIYASTV